MTMVSRMTRLAVAGAAAAFASIAPAFADKDAESYVAGILLEANDVFQAPDLATRNAGVEKLVDKYVDMTRVAKFALGQYVRQASDAQMAE